MLASVHVGMEICMLWWFGWKSSANVVRFWYCWEILINVYCEGVGVAMRLNHNLDWRIDLRNLVSGAFAPSVTKFCENASSKRTSRFSFRNPPPMVAKSNLNHICKFCGGGHISISGPWRAQSRHHPRKLHLPGGETFAEWDNIIANLKFLTFVVALWAWQLPCVKLTLWMDALICIIPSSVHLVEGTFQFHGHGGKHSHVQRLHDLATIQENCIRPACQRKSIWGMIYHHCRFEFPPRNFLPMQRVQNAQRVAVCTGKKKNTRRNVNLK